MIDLLLLALAARAEPAYEPPAQVFYPQAVACAASARVEKSRNPTPSEAADMMTWGLIIADMGRKAGRTREQVESLDIKAAEAFYRRLKKTKPPAFAAYRSYCRALLVADRP